MIHALTLTKWLLENPQEWFRQFTCTDFYGIHMDEPPKPTEQQQEHIEHLKEVL